MSRRRNHPAARAKRDLKKNRGKLAEQANLLKRAGALLLAGDYAGCMDIILPLSKVPVAPIVLSDCEYYSGLVAYKLRGIAKAHGQGELDRRAADEMIWLMKKRLRTNPDDAYACYNLAAMLAEVDETEEAVLCLEHAVAVAPGLAQAWGNLGNARLEQGRYDDALQCYERAAALSGEGDSEAFYNISIALLLLGRYKEGWALYERRREVPMLAVDYARPDLPMPYWHGEDLAGKTLLLHGEQGFGDIVMTLRFLPRLRAMLPDTTLAWEIHPGLAGLMAPLVQPGETVYVAGQPGPRSADYRVSYMSLVARTGLASTSDLPPATIFERPTPATLPSANGRKRVGFYWRGAPGHRNDHKRSTTLDRWDTLLRDPRVQWVCLQADVTDLETAYLRKIGVYVPAPSPDRTWSDTAALMVACDHVIGVDSAIAHVAGALGVEGWVMLAAAADFRWLLGREDSPWYPTHRLFRQPTSGDWPTVFARIREALGLDQAVAA